MEKENKKLNNSELIENDYSDIQDERDISFDELENAPDDLTELFEEPPILELDFDEEPSDDDLKLEEMNVENLDDEVRAQLESIKDNENEIFERCFC